MFRRTGALYLVVVTAMLLSASLSQGASLPVGFVSVDPAGTGSAATFDILNQTGLNASVYPDTTFPVVSSLGISNPF